MSLVNRFWVAMSVVVVNCHSNQLQKFKSGLRSLNHGKNHRYFSGAADLRPFPGAFMNGGSFFNKGRPQKDESLRQVMYLNCWAQS